MNNIKLKKFLTLLVTLLLISSVCLLAACNKEPDSTIVDEPEVASPSFTNGSFANNASTSDTVVYPFAPSSWTGYPSSNPANLPELTNTTAGVISLNSTLYADNKSLWGDLPIFAKSTLYSEEGYDDDNVLMIYNREPSYYYYRSNSFSVSANKFYQIALDVKTANLGGNDNKGATLSLIDNADSATIAEYAQIIDSDWTRYYFYVKTGASSSTLRLKLMLGQEATVETSPYLTSGYAFFDNVEFTALTYEEDDEDVAFDQAHFDALTENATHKKVDTAMPNTEFDFATTAGLPTKYTKVDNTYSTTAQGRIDIADTTFDWTKYGLAESSKISTLNTSAVGTNVYGLYHSSLSKYGLYTTTALSFTRGNAYRVSIWVNTEYLAEGEATLALCPNISNFSDGATLGAEYAVAGWKQYSFYVCANQNTNASLYFQIWLGTADATARGAAFFDTLEITKLDITEHDVDYYFDNDSTSASKIILDKSTDDSDNLVNNGYFNKDGGSTDNWTDGTYADGFSLESTPVAVSNIDVTDEGYIDVLSPYYSVSNRVLKVNATKPAIYTIKYSNLKTDLQPYTAYRFSVWVKTVDVQSTAGVTLTVYNNDDANNPVAMAAYAFVNTANMAETDGLNGYRELVYYIYTDNASHSIYFELAFGTGTRYTSTTFFDGTAYIANVSLVEVLYSEFNSSTASGTYAKNYNYNKTATTTYSNGQFDAYDMTTTENFREGGKPESGDFTKNFANPSGWTFVKDDTLLDDDDNLISGIYAGIVDLKRANLITNLITDAALTGNTDLSGYDFNGNNYMFNYTGTNPKYYFYNTESSALMLSSKPQDIDADFVSAGYTTSKSVSLAANSYYEISVLVKVVSGEASVYLMTDNRSEASAKKEHIGVTTSEYSETNGWKRVTFRIKVGLSATSVQLGLYLGGTNTPTEIADNVNDATGGLVFFDRISQKTITADDYAAASATAESEEEVIKVGLDIDSFGLASTTNHSTSSGQYITPASSNWSGVSDADNDENNWYGIVINSKYNFSEYADGLQDVLIGNNGSDSALVINNKVAGAYHFATSTKTFAKNSYYLVTVFAKTHGVAEDSKAYIKLSVNGKDPTADANNTNIIYFNTGDTNAYQEFKFIIKTPENDALTSLVKLELGLGEVDGDEQTLVAGIAVFDDVSFVLLDDATEYDAYKGDNNTANVKTLEYVDSSSTDPVTPDTPVANPEDGNKGEYSWLIFGSVAFGAVIVIVVIVYFVKKYWPKRKAAQALKKTDKKQEDKYKDLND